MAPNFVEKGIAVAAVNYTLRPDATLDEIVAETRRSISWLYQNGADYGCDPERIYIAGSSAGGHLAGMLASGGWQEDFSVPSDVIKGGMLGLAIARTIVRSHGGDITVANRDGGGAIFSICLPTEN